MADPEPRSLGIHIAAGCAYAAVAEGPEGVLFDDPLERLELARSLAGADQLADFSARFKQEVRRIKPCTVGVVYPKLYSNWKYSDAFRRVAIETAIMLGVSELSTPARPIAYVQVKQDSMAKALEIPLPKFSERAKARWGDGVPRYQKDRLYAVAAAAYLAQEAAP